jgi:hypothetical protein
MALPIPRCIVKAAAGAILAWGFWWAGLIWIKGWMSLAWLDEFNWAAIPICLCIAGTTALCMSPTDRGLNLPLYILTASGIMLAAYAIGRMAVFDIVTAWFVTPPFALMALAVCYAAVCISLPLLTNRLLAPVYVWKTAAGLAAALPVAIILSYATITIFPAINGSRDAVHMFKMGYPVFWVALLVPLTLRLGRKSGKRGGGETGR